MNRFNDNELRSFTHNPTPITAKLNAIIDSVESNDAMRNKALSGDLVFKLTPATVNASEGAQNRGAGVKQKETLTPVITDTNIVTAGNAKLTINATGATAIEITFSVAEGDAAADVVTKAKAALNVAAVTNLYTVDGIATTVTLEKKVAAANDTGLQLKIEPVTCGAELAAVISANTVAGVAPYTRNVVVTLEDAEGNVHDWFSADISVAVSQSTDGDGAIDIADSTPAMVNGTVTVPITYSGTFTKGTKQVETATVVGAITTSGNASVVVTAAGMTGSPKTIAVAVLGQAQIETATVVGTIDVAGVGDATVIVTAAGMTNSPKTVSVAVANNDTSAQVGGKIRTALGLDADVNAFFTISGADANIILTAQTIAANDATMNISIDNGTCTGLTAAPTSADTRAGNAQDDANAIAGKIRTALGDDAAVTALYDVSGATDKVILTRKVYAANDATLNIAVDNGTCAGITTAANSANTAAGVAPDTNTLTLAQQTIVGYTVAQKTSVETSIA